MIHHLQILFLTDALWVIKTVSYWSSPADGGITVGWVLMPHSPYWFHRKSSCINSLVPGKVEWNFRYVIFQGILVTDGWGTSGEIALIWMSVDFTGDQSTLVQVMAWCRQATSHYLSQCWPRSLTPYGVTRPQCINSLPLGDAAVILKI